MHTQHRPSMSSHLNIFFSRSPPAPPPTPHFYRQMLALCGPFEKGAPQSPIANSRRKEATAWWVCPCEVLSQWALLGTNGGNWVLKQKCFGSLRDKICVRNSNAYHKTINTIYNMVAELCHIYSSTSLICALRLLKHNINNHACKTSTQHVQPSKQ